MFHGTGYAKEVGKYSIKGEITDIWKNSFSFTKNYIGFNLHKKICTLEEKLRLKDKQIDDRNFENMSLLQQLEKKTKELDELKEELSSRKRKRNEDNSQLKDLFSQSMIGKVFNDTYAWKEELLYTSDNKKLFMTYFTDFEDIESIDKTSFTLLELLIAFSQKYEAQSYRKRQIVNRISDFFCKMK